MEEKYLSFAALFFIIKRTGINYIDNTNSITLYYGNGVGHVCPVMQGKKNSDCGYIAISNFDYDNLFGDYTHLVDLETNEPYEVIKCERSKNRNDDGSIEHCKVDLSVREKVNITRDNGDIIKCLNLRQSIKC